jgi:hypothetical protein
VNRRVGIVGVGDVVGDGLVGDAAEDAEHRQGVEVVVVGAEVPRPVDPEVAPLEPGAVVAVLLDHIQLLAGGRVVLVGDVEVPLDAEDRRDDAVLRRPAEALAVRSVDALVRHSRDEVVLGDLPPDAGHRLGVGRREQPVLGGAVPDVDEGRLRPELGIVGGVGQVLTDEVLLVEGEGLDPVDRRPLLGTGGEEQARGQAGGNAAHQPSSRSAPRSRRRSR